MMSDDNDIVVAVVTVVVLFSDAHNCIRLLVEESLAS